MRRRTGLHRSTTGRTGEGYGFGSPSIGTAARVALHLPIDTASNMLAQTIGPLKREFVDRGDLRIPSTQLHAQRLLNAARDDTFTKILSVATILLVLGYVDWTRGGGGEIT